MPKILLRDDPIIAKSELTEDLQMLVDHLLEFIRDDSGINENRTWRFPILLSGDWGSGKTSVLKVLEKEVKENGSEDLVTLWFDAWNYEHEQNLLPVLIRNVWENAPNKKKRAVKKAFKRALGLSLLATVVTLSTHITALGSVPKILKNLDLLKADPEIPPDPIEDLRIQFNQLVAEGWSKKKRLVIFIDDLDRLPPDKATNLLDAVRLLVCKNDLSCRFLVALDRTTIDKAIKYKYKGIENFNGHRYLEKIFPISFQISSFGKEQARGLLSSFRNTTNMGSEEIRILNRSLIQPIFCNPRLMKKTVNHFLLIRDWESQFSSTLKKRNIDSELVLVFWIAAIERWPWLRTMLRREEEEYWIEIDKMTQETRDNSKLGLIAPETQNLLAEPDLLIWMQTEGILRDRNKRNIYRRADKRLCRLGL